MSRLSHLDLKRALSGGRLSPLYLLMGEEDFQRERAARAIREAALAGCALREFNDDIYDLSKTDASEAVAAARQYPMMCDRRVVRITGLEKASAEDEERLAYYLASPSETTVAIFIANELDGRRKFTKTIQDGCATVGFPRLKQAEVPAWINSRIAEMNLRADPAVARELAETAGNNLRKLDSELQKLAAAAAETGVITREAVAALVKRSRELGNFELTDHLIARDRRSALVTLHRLLEDDVEPLMLLGAIASNYHRLAVARELIEQGVNEADAAKQVGLVFPGKKRDDFLRMAKRSSGSELARSLRRIAETDLAIKSSRATPRLQMELLVCELLK